MVAPLSNCIKVSGVIPGLLQVILICNELEEGGGSVFLLGFSFVAGLCVLVVFGVRGLILPSKIVRFWVVGWSRL